MLTSAETYKGLIWSTSRPSDEALIRAALLKPRFHTLLNMALDWGYERVAHEWELLRTENTEEAQRAAEHVTRILRNIQTGFQHAETGN